MHHPTFIKLKKVLTKSTSATRPLGHDTVNLQEEGESMFRKAKKMILGQGLEEEDLRDKE